VLSFVRRIHNKRNKSREGIIPTMRKAFVFGPAITLLVCGSIFGAWTVSSAATYTVCPSGGGCDYSTLTSALDGVRSGNTIEIKNGTYAEKPYTKASNVIIKAATGHTPHVRGIFIDHDNITIDGLYFDTQGETTSYQYRISIASNKTGFLIQNVHTGIACSGGVSVCQWGDINVVAGTSTGQILNNHFDHPTYVSFMISGNTYQISIQGNHWTNAHADILYLWGSKHLIKDNEIENTIGDSPLHADFVQTFGGDQAGSYGSGGASYGHIIEGNYIHGNPNNLQPCNLEQKGNPDTRDWTFRNNIFENVAYAGNIYIPGVKFYNNLFINTTYNTASPIMSGPATIVGGTDGKRYTPKKFVINADANKPITGGDWATYWVEDTTHINTSAKTWTNGSYYFPGPDSGDSMEIKNNIFIGCGSVDGNNDGRGWYNVDTGVLNFSASNNYVSKRADYATPFGAKTGWNTSNGNINGGDPKFVNYKGNDFRLQSDSPLIGKGATIAGWTNPTDKNGITRPQGTGWDIGPYGYVPGSGLLSPKNLRVSP
jgi:hypothetical protein